MEIASDEEGGRLQSCACSVYGVGVEQFICLLTFKGKMKWSWNITVLNSWRLVPPLYLDTPRHHYLSFMKCLTASETEVDVTTSRQRSVQYELTSLLPTPGGSLPALFRDRC